MPIFRQCRDGDVCVVSYVYHAHLRVARRHVKGVLCRDGRAEVQEALHVKVGAENRIRQTRRLERRFDHRVIVLETAGRVHVGAELRQLHNMRNAAPRR
jgi:hypothetical protein